MSSRLQLLALWSGLSAGAVCGTLVFCLLFPWLEGLVVLDEKFLALLPSNLLAAVGATLLFRFFPRLTPSREHAPFWIGVGLALAPLLCLGIIRIVGRNERISGELLPALLGISLAIGLGWLLPRLIRIAPRMRMNMAIVGVAMVAFLALYFRLGVAEVDERYASIPPMPESAVLRAERPDVILISIDTLRADALFSRDVELFGIKSLQQKGFLQDYALAPASMTLPSHATMLSGRSPLRYGAWDNKSRIPKSLPMMAEWFKEAGWRTAAVVSNNILRKSTGLARGFEVYSTTFRREDTGDLQRRYARRIIMVGGRMGSWHGWLLPHKQAERISTHLSDRRKPQRVTGSGDDNVDQTTAVALHYLDELMAADSPYFFFLHFLDPHAPYLPKELVSGRLAEPRTLPEAYSHLARSASGVDTRNITADLAQGKPGAMTAARHLQNLYLEEVLYLDIQLQKILARIRRSQRPTLILLTSDHGEQFGEHKLLNHNNSLYEPLLRVPFVLAGPGVGAGESFPTQPHLEDLAPTLMNLAGLVVPTPVDGINLMNTRPEFVRGHWAWMPELFAYRENGWKLLGSFKREEEGYSEIRALELYDLNEDPGEQINLLEAEHDRVNHLLVTAKSLLEEAAVGRDMKMTPQLQADLDELGYMQGKPDNDGEQKPVPENRGY